MGNTISGQYVYKVYDYIQSFTRDANSVDTNQGNTNAGYVNSHDANVRHVNGGDSLHPLNLPNNLYYTLYIYIDDLDVDIKQLYIDMINKNNCIEYFNGTSSNISLCTFNSGFDLFMPYDLLSKSGELASIDFNIKCAMKMGDRYVGYYLYARSSTGKTTPLRMANSLGIIDSGYRGNIKVCVDNIYRNDFSIVKGNRYFQICPPSLEYPIKVVVVDSVDKLGNTNRGEGGFGSTGK